MSDTLVGDLTEQDEDVQNSGQPSMQDDPVGAEPGSEDDDSIDDAMPVPFYGIAAPTGGESDDRRAFAARGLTWRSLPLPLTYQIMTDDGHKRAVTIGSITDMWYDENDMIAYKGMFADPTLEPYVDKVIGGIAEGWIRGVSVDVVAAQYALPAIPDQFESADQLMELINNPPAQVMESGKVAGLCVVTIPAFEDTYIRVGDCDCGADELPADQTVPPLEEGIDPEAPIEEDDPILASARAEFRQGLARMIEADEEVLGFAVAVSPEDTYDNLDAVIAAAFAPGTHDGPGWITHPVATNRIRRYWVHGKGAAKIGWGAPNDFYRCRGQLRKYVSNPDWLSGLCANMHKEALGVWPGQEGGGGNHGHGSLLAAGMEIDMAPAAPYNIVASAAAPTLPPTAWFRDPGLTGPTALQVTDDGRVFGHVATWNVCHIGMQGKCTTAPRSRSGYAYFKTGVVRTTEGDVAVGHITMGTGHASLGARPMAAAAHYDNTGSVIADVSAGEDQYGIWVSGAVRPGATDEQKFALRGAALSGDWRTIGGSKEMVAALAVNVPGFPIPRTEVLIASGEEALVAAAIVQNSGQPTPAVIETPDGQVHVGEIPAQYAIQPGTVQVNLPEGVDVDAIVASVMDRLDRAENVRRAKSDFSAATRDDIVAAALAALED